METYCKRCLNSLTCKHTVVTWPDLPAESTEVQDHYYRTKAGKAYITPLSGLT